MNSWICSLLLLAVCLAGSQSRRRFVTPAPRQPPMCRNSRITPCKMRIDMRYLNGTQGGYAESRGCRCSHTRGCPSNWDDANNVITKELVSTTHEMTMKMKFCGGIAPRRVCNSTQRALIMKGPMVMPTDIENYACRCESDMPLRLKLREVRTYYNYYHEYVCDNHMLTCTLPILPCMRIDDVSVQYNCKCPGRQQCREDPEADEYDEVIHGYCMD